MSDSTTCGRCGAEMLEDSAGGLCPRCLMALNFDSRTMPGDEAPPKAAPLSPEEMKERFPQFEILECLGRGGMGVVYKARQKSLNRLVALKLLAPERGHDARFAERFAREAELLAKLNHPHIVTIHDFGETGGLFYLVMEFVDGVNLRDLLRDGKLDPQQALAIVPPVCEALQYAHDKGIVHRDIKPENLLLDRDGRVKIADFGIAALVGAGGEVAGTPPYMAPEQAGNPTAVDHRADIYALGVVLYEMLTGERPAKELVAPSKKVRIDVRLDEIVLRALEKTPELRYQTAGILKTQIETILLETGSAGVPPAPVDVPSTATPGTANGGTPSAARGTRTLPANPQEPQKLVAVPAIGLMVASGLNLLLAGGLLVSMILLVGGPAHGPMSWPLHQRTALTFLLLFVVGLPALLTFIGAWRMKRLRGYGLAVTASILAILTPPGLLIGLVFGIWALVVLARRDVQDGFRQNAASSGKGCLIAGLAAVGVILLLFLTLIGFRLLHVGGGHASTPPPAVFGPESVVTLPDPAAGIPCVLDFETGKLLVPPAEIIPLLNRDISQWPPAARRWLRDEGADAVLAPDGSLNLLEGVVFHPTRNGQAFTWDEFDPDFVITLANGLSEAERSAAPNQTEFHLVTTRQPAAVAFTTRERSRGIVQVMGANPSPRGVRIRYKLVDAPHITAIPAATSKHATGETIAVEVTGLVAQPGQHSLRKGATLLDALAAAGGWTGDGNLRAEIAGPDKTGVSESTSHDLKAILDGRAINPTVPEGARVTLSNTNP